MWHKDRVVDVVSVTLDLLVAKLLLKKESVCNLARKLLHLMIFKIRQLLQTAAFRQ